MTPANGSSDSMIRFRFYLSLNPIRGHTTGIRRNNNVIMTSFWRHYDFFRVSTGQNGLFLDKYNRTSP